MKLIKLILAASLTLIIGLTYLLFSRGEITFAKYEKGKMIVNYQNGKSQTFYGSTGYWVNHEGKEVDYITGIQLNELWDHNQRFGVPFPENESN